MKKLVEVFCKNKSNSYNVCKDVRLESSKNVSSEEMSNSNSYKSFQFDTNCLAICENKLCCTGNSGHEIKFLKKNTQPLIALPTSPQVLTDCKSLTLDNSYEIIKDLLTSETKEKREKSAINSHLENLKKSTWLNTAGTLIKVQNQPKRDVNPQLNKMQKKNNVYVINVTNSKDFHIGSQTTVNVHKLENFKHVENKITDFSTEWEELLDSEEKLTKNMIWIIATNFENQWKSFGINLGLSEDVLDEMEARYDNKTFKVYDTLQKYVKLYPNTSLGFVANVLKENKQLNVAQKLIQNKVKY